jgi:hypothetical protein
MSFPTTDARATDATATAAALDYARGLAEEHFWGFLTLKFEDGKVVHLRREENLRPNDLPGRYRGQNDTYRR